MDPAVRARLDSLRAEYEEVLGRLASPDVASDPKRYGELGKRISELEEVARAYEEYESAAAEATEARDLLRDAGRADEKEYYRSTAEEAEARVRALEERLGQLLTPRDPRDDRDVIVEIRAGAGGDEAGLFAGDLLRMYQGYASRQGWRTEVLDASEGAVGGVREVVFEVKGKGAYSKLKHESGVHRVQRVPVTESQGRIHTSTATVAVLPTADDVHVRVDPGELRVDTFRASGPGGQHVNTTDSAVRITHIPSGLVVSMQSERSQRQNHERAMRVLVAKLQALAEQEARDELAAERRSQVGTGDRSERIRTYNFPQNRVTDHRIGVSIHGMDQIMSGAIDELVDALRRAEDVSADAPIG